MINFIAEIGINHNGSFEMCKKMIMFCKSIDIKYVKIQKRNPDKCVPEHQKATIRKTPWGEMTYLEYKKKIEFTDKQIEELAAFCKQLDIVFFASVWDLDSVDMMKKHSTVCKIGSACITDLELCKSARDNFEFLIISTGMSTEKEIEECVKVCNPDVIMHSNSTYPCPDDELNLRYLTWLKEKYPTKEIGYSGHEYRLCTTLASVVLGATWIERHFTMDRHQWGSDHLSSVEPAGLISLINDIRAIESSIKYEPQERILFEKEKLKRDSLRLIL